MHVASDDRFVSLKANGDRMDDTFFFYRAGYRMAGREERPQKKSHKKIVLLLVFLVVRDRALWFIGEVNEQFLEIAFLWPSFTGKQV